MAADPPDRSRRAGPRTGGSRRATILTMKTASLDVLRKAQLSPGQAQAILRAMEIEIGEARSGLATKVDLVDLKSELRRDIADLRAEFGLALGRAEGRLARWALTCILAQTAVLVGAGYFVLGQLRR